MTVKNYLHVSGSTNISALETHFNGFFDQLVSDLELATSILFKLSSPKFDFVLAVIIKDHPACQVSVLPSSTTMS
jgi:hypothetical protein